MEQLLLSPFAHIQAIPIELNELWAKAFNLAATELIEAIEFKEPNRERKLSTAARWYAGLPQLLLRDPQREQRRSNPVIERRLVLFIDGKYLTLLQEWQADSQRARRKMKPPKKDNEELRLRKANELIHKGYISRALNTLEGNGKAHADDPAIQQQMKDKHPRVEGEQFLTEAPMPAERNLSLPHLRNVVKKTKLLVGVGTRGLKAGHIKPLESGAFLDDDARSAGDVSFFDTTHVLVVAPRHETDGTNG